MKYEIIGLNWYKRRHEIFTVKEVKKIEFNNFKKEHYSICNMTVYFSNNDIAYLTGQVLFNKIKKYWTINGINLKGEQIAIKLLDL